MTHKREMALKQPSNFHCSNFHNNCKEEVDFDFFDYSGTNDNNSGNEQNCVLNSPCRPTQFLTEAIIEHQRENYINSIQDEMSKEDEINCNSRCVENYSDLNLSEEDINSSNLNLVNCIAYEDKYNNETFEDDVDSFESLSESTNTSDFTNVTPISSSNGSLNMCKQSVSLEEIEEHHVINKIKEDAVVFESSSSEDREFAALTKCVETLSIPGSSTCSKVMSSYSGKSKPKRKSMTFTNEQIRKINRDNDILLKKIMAHAKPRPKQTSTIHNFHPTRTSAAINRYRQQKQIEHDNYILLSKIRGVKQTRKSIFETGFR